LALPAS